MLLSTVFFSFNRKKDQTKGLKVERIRVGVRGCDSMSAREVGEGEDGDVLIERKRVVGYLSSKNKKAFK